jgi:hypothetical protein
MSKPREIKKPSLFYFLTEMLRAIWESIVTRFFLRKFKANPNVKGDGHHVLVIPGFMASDFSTSMLRKYINRLGFKAHPWGLGRNYADLDDIEKLTKKVIEFNEESGQKVTLIGWSLGGIYARKLTKDMPERVDQLITLGSPYMGIREPNRAERTYQWIKKGQKIKDVKEEWIDKIQEPVDVPTTAIYSKKDGIVSWKVCREEKDTDMHRNVEVKCSHIGMGMHKEVLKIVGDVLLDFTKEKEKAEPMKSAMPQ